MINFAGNNDVTRDSVGKKYTEINRVYTGGCLKTDVTAIKPGDACESWRLQVEVELAWLRQIKIPALISHEIPKRLEFGEEVTLFTGKFWLDQYARLARAHVAHLVNELKWTMIFHNAK